MQHLAVVASSERSTLPTAQAGLLSQATCRSVTSEAALQDESARHEAVLAQSRHRGAAEVEQLARQLQACQDHTGQLQQEVAGLGRALSAAQAGLEQSLAKRSASEQAHAAALAQAHARIDMWEPMPSCMPDSQLVTTSLVGARTVRDSDQHFQPARM